MAAAGVGATAELAYGKPQAGVLFQMSCTVGLLLRLTPSVVLFAISAAKGDLGHVHASALSLTSVSSIAYLVGFGSILAYTAYGWLLKNAATPLLSTYAYVNPAVAVLLGWAFAGERLAARELVAGLVILSSVALILLARKPAPAKVVELPRRTPSATPERAAA